MSLLRLMPSFLIRLRRVLGFRLSKPAAPLGPSIFHVVRLSTSTMCLRSISSSVSGSVSA